ncbi:Phosphatidylinositol 4-phosphate 3-kinase C2 domain-containing subunit alpha [Nymphon striatum]|nr:Phosphatidylinositol 4-phosphate 3-kinase C2 domain-containing subunit alpha [Nymphon striatum]
MLASTYNGSEVQTSVEHVISHVVCSVFDDMSNVCSDDYVLKVHGLTGFLSSEAQLCQYEYIHLCLKYNLDVKFDLISTKDLKCVLARTAEDDENDISVLTPSYLLPQDSPGMPVRQESVNILIETFENEVNKLNAHTLETCASGPIQIDGVIQAVKAICVILSNIETSFITETISYFRTVAEFLNKNEECEIIKVYLPPHISDILKLNSINPNAKVELLNTILEDVRTAVRDLLEMYRKVFHENSSVLSTTNPEGEIEEDSVSAMDISNLSDVVVIHVGSVHRIGADWDYTFDVFQVICTLFHGDKSISSAVATQPTPVSESFNKRLHFDEWLQFENETCTLPRETRAVFKLYGMKIESNERQSGQTSNTVPKLIGWNSVHLFKHDSFLIRGSVMYGLWPPTIKDIAGPSISNTHDSQAPLLQVNFLEINTPFFFPPVADHSLQSQRKSFDELDVVTQSKITDIIQKDILSSCTPEEAYLIWDKRHYLYDFPKALPRVILSTHSWNWACLSNIYDCLNNWKPLEPVDALQLLLPSFPDIQVREMAIQCIEKISNDELCDYLPQIVQTLKFDTWLNSPTVQFILERSLQSVRVAHNLYWLLKQNLDDPRYGQRMGFILNTLLAIIGKAMRERFKTQENLVKALTETADRLKNTKESIRLASLFRELESIHHELCERNTNLPLDPCIEVNGVDVKSCFYFNSHTLPLKLTFTTIEGGAHVDTIYKVGDDLRQDSLTLQMIHIMDKLWLREGLDLKIVTFKCITTGDKKGFVEMVTNSETLRKIHTESAGVTGSFNDRVLSDWLQKHNPSELEYQQAIENFTVSCAGYAVATYILGICDRHNDNIMLKTSGHLFHIDFGKFLGDAQMFGNIKRDRVPFVLTPDMVYAINGGDRPSSKFQYFIDLCCQAFNIIRKNRNTFLNLFHMMATSGISGVTAKASKYVQNILLPGQSDAEAITHFSRLIEESLRSKFTQLNFFIHNVFQQRYSGDHNDNNLLSFVPKTYKMENEGKILSASLYGVQKRYDQEKYYVYIIKVEREKQTDPSYVLRSYRECYEFDQKLHATFPLAAHSALSRDIHFGRSNIRQVADKRKLMIEQMLKSLFSMAHEIAHSDIVYTFFHPLLRDQQESAAHCFHQQKDLKLKRRESISLGSLRGQIKLSIHFKAKVLNIMVMHAKYLVSRQLKPVKWLEKSFAPLLLALKYFPQFSWWQKDRVAQIGLFVHADVAKAPENVNCSKGILPDSYVKTYLLPDPNKFTKRKTRIIRKNSHPSFMEMLIYDLPSNVVKRSQMQVSVWHYESLQENEFLGGFIIDLTSLNLSKETVTWYPLGVIM